MNMKIQKVFQIFLRIVFTRLTTAFVVFFAAVYFQPEILSRIAVLVILVNISELLVENGTFESLLKKFEISKVRNARVSTFFISLLTSSTVVLLYFFDAVSNFSLLLLICFFLQALVTPTVIYLKYKNHTHLLFKLYRNAGIALLLTFFVVQMFVKNELSVIFAYISYYLVLTFSLKIRLNFFKNPIKDLKIDSDALSSFIFKLTNFFNSRVIEIIIPFNFGMLDLSSYVAGSRIYNIINLFFYTILNELALKKFISTKEILYLYFRYAVFIVVPLSFFVFLFKHNIPYFVDFFYGQKYEHAEDVLSIFCTYLIFQVIAMPFIQLQMIHLSTKESLINNLACGFALFSILNFIEYGSLVELVESYVFFLVIWTSFVTMYILNKIGLSFNLISLIFVFTPTFLIVERFFFNFR